MAIWSHENIAIRFKSGLKDPSSPDLVHFLLEQGEA